MPPKISGSNHSSHHPRANPLHMPQPHSYTQRRPLAQPTAHSQRQPQQLATAKASAAPATAPREQGTIIKVFKRGSPATASFGFVQPPDGSHEIFVKFGVAAHEGAPLPFRIGDHVTFQRQPDPYRPGHHKAVQLRLDLSRFTAPTQRTASARSPAQRHPLTPPSTRWAKGPDGTRGFRMPRTVQSRK